MPHANNRILHSICSFFESKVRPLLIEHCYECHSEHADDLGGNLRLDTAAATLAGGDLGPAIVPGQPDASLIIKAIGYQKAELQMPPDRKLDEDSAGILRQWIQMGAPDPRTDSDESGENSDSPTDHYPRQHPGVEQSDVKHWAFTLPKRIVGPATPTPRSRDVIDAVVSDHAEKHGLEINSRGRTRDSDSTLVLRPQRTSA